MVGAPICFSLGALEVEVHDGQPQGVEALIVEEDTFLVLSAPPEIREVREHPMRVLTGVLEAKPHPLGSIQLREGAPLVLRAVVDALEEDPPGSLPAVERALEAAFAEILRRRMRWVGLELLGAIHGGLDPSAISDLLAARLQTLPPGSLARLSIVTRSRDREGVAERLRSSYQR